MEDDIKKRMHSVIRHIQGVQANCHELARRLTDEGEAEFAKTLIANSYLHDNSKFHGIEWEHLHERADERMFAYAIKQHITTNPHHPEYWSSIHEMPRIYLAEMMCDTLARSQEFGTDIKEWFNEKALKKYKFSRNCRVYKEIKSFMDLLLEKKFE